MPALDRYGPPLTRKPLMTRLLQGCEFAPRLGASPVGGKLTDPAGATEVRQLTALDVVISLEGYI